MHNILLEIIENKKKEIKEGTERFGRDYKSLPATGESLFKEKILHAKDIALIAEIKLASPTHPNLGSEKEILERAIMYEQAGANAISFITEKKYFKGNIAFIPKIKEKVSLPVLQKDFVIDPYQIYQAKETGSDALLLIAKLLDKKTLQEFVSLCQKIGIEPVVEINDGVDLEKAIATTTNIIAVNARNLENFTIDVEKACELLRKIPDNFIKLGFSGIHSSKEVREYQKAGAKGILIGTEVMKAENVGEFLQQLKM